MTHSLSTSLTRRFRDSLQPEAAYLPPSLSSRITEATKAIVDWYLSSSSTSTSFPSSDERHYVKVNGAESYGDPSLSPAVKSALYDVVPRSLGVETMKRLAESPR